MEESVKLVKGQLRVHRLLLVPLVQELHLEKDHAFARVGTHAISGRNYKHKRERSE